MRAEHTMTRKVFFLLPTDSLRDAHEFMQALDIRHIPILEATEVVGMLSDRDILRNAVLEDGELSVPHDSIFNYMSTQIISCRPRSTIEEVANLMLDHRIDALPVLDEEYRLKGLITSSDLLELLSIPSGLSPKEQIPFLFELSNPRDMASGA